MKTLNQYGAGCRCLMRMRGNEGEPVISDQVFIESYRDRFPQWENCPGQMDSGMLCDLAKDLKLAAHIDFFRDYERVLHEHRAGHSILTITERAPQRKELNPPPARYTLLVMAMDELAFTVWCPYPDGTDDMLEKIGREWWNRWYSIGMVMQSTASMVARPPVPFLDTGKIGSNPVAEKYHRTDIHRF